VKFRKYLLDYSASNGINSYGIKCWPELPKRGLNPCFLIGLLNDEGIITGAEADFNGTLTMLIEHYLTDGRIPYLTDLIKVDEEMNTCVFWHCGCASPSLAAGDKQKCTDCKSNSSNENSNVKESSNNISSRVTIQKQFRGLDRGPAAEFPLKEGRLTVARLDNRDGKYQMFITEGEALPTEMILRGTPSIVRMDAPVNKILKAIIGNGVSHHYAIVYGSHKEKLIEFCRLLNIEVICPEIM
jgi:L-fucose isomerase-like protein